MSIHSSASIVYGFRITNEKLIEDIGEESISIKAEFDISYSGYAEGDECGVFLCIKDSVIRVNDWDGSKFIDPFKLVTSADWGDKLKAWAKEHGTKATKIGWHLLVNVC